MNTTVPKIGETFNNSKVIARGIMPERMGRYGGLVIKPELAKRPYIVVRTSETTQTHVLTADGWKRTE